jgi:hypothetical protein
MPTLESRAMSAYWRFLFFLSSIGPCAKNKSDFTIDCRECQQKSARFLTPELAAANGLRAGTRKRKRVANKNN